MFVLDLDKVHSYVDIITNSSTVIYTWSEGSVDKAKDLLRAMFDLFGEKDIDVEKEFVFRVLTDDETPSWYWLRTYMKEHGVQLPFVEPPERGDAYNEYAKDMQTFSNDLFSNFVLNNSLPDWYPEFVKEYLVKEEDNDDYYSDYRPSNKLFIFSKNEKYKPIIDEMISFLYSTDHDGVYNG